MSDPQHFLEHARDTGARARYQFALLLVDRLIRRHGFDTLIGHFRACLTHRLRVLLRDAGDIAIVGATGALFAAVHAPQWDLVAVTALAGWLWSARGDSGQSRSRMPCSGRLTSPGAAAKT